MIRDDVSFFSIRGRVKGVCWEKMSILVFLSLG